jgi:RNA polymerase sigma-70 factor (ECF subfamily)
VNFKSGDDNFLASAIRNSNMDAYEELFHRYKKKLYYFSLRYVDDIFDAEELVQTVFINLWEHRCNLDDSQSVRNYLYKSAVNLIYNNLRKKAIRRNYLKAEMLKPEKSENNTYDHLFYLDLEKEINKIIISLPLQQQKIFNLSRFDGLSHQEIAGKLKLSVRTVENQIYRVTKILREHLRTEFAP